MSNVVHLPRPASLRPSPVRLGHYLRVAWNDHKEVLNLIAGGEKGYLGYVIDATNVGRHRDLISDALKKGFDVILEPKTQASALPGSFSHSLGELPWGVGRQHGYVDFRGAEALERVKALSEFAAKHGFTQVIAPTHLINGPQDPWFSIDVEAAKLLRDHLLSKVGIIYSLSLPMRAFRETRSREQLLAQLMQVPMDALWLKIENFGSDASGEKLSAYLEAATTFHSLGIPIIADHVGGAPGLGLLAFGATGGIAHGVMALEKFAASSWRRPPADGNPHPAGRRVYIPELDLLLPREQAESLLNHSSRTKGRYGCRDSGCCAGGVRDMLAHPVRHYLHQRAREVEKLSGVPSASRVQFYVENTVRRKSDAMAAVASLGLTDNRLAASMQDRHRAMGKFRGVVAHLAESYSPASVSPLPSAREQRNTSL